MELNYTPLLMLFGTCAVFALAFLLWIKGTKKGRKWLADL